MDDRIVGMMEREIEAAIAAVITRHWKPPRLPLLPSQRTFHLMAKAAVAVYECALENRGDRLPGNEA